MRAARRGVVLSILSEFRLKSEAPLDRTRRGRGISSPRNVRVAAAAAPRLVSAEHPRGARGRAALRGQSRGGRDRAAARVPLERAAVPAVAEAQRRLGERARGAAEAEVLVVVVELAAVNRVRPRLARHVPERVQAAALEHASAQALAVARCVLQEERRRTLRLTQPRLAGARRRHQGQGERGAHRWRAQRDCGEG